MPASALSSLSPESEAISTVGGLKTQRQRATLTLTSITLPQLGGFLEAWRRREPAWVATSIDVTPENGKPVTPGADLPLRVVLAVETLRLANSGGDQ